MSIRGPYSIAIKYNDLLFVSGQGAFIGSSNDIATTIKEQTHQTLINIKRILDDSGSSVSKIVKATVYLKDIKDFETMNKAYTQFFDENGLKNLYPARTTISCQLPKSEMLIEIDVIAAIH